MNPNNDYKLQLLSKNSIGFGICIDINNKNYSGLASKRTTNSTPTFFFNGKINNLKNYLYYSTRHNIVMRLKFLETNHGRYQKII